LHHELKFNVIGMLAGLVLIGVLFLLPLHERWY